MATRIRDKISLLNKSRVLYRLFIFTAVEVTTIFVIQLMFSRLEAEHIKSVTTVIGSMLRDESLMSRSYLLAQSIEDMHSYGVLKCASLSRINNGITSTFYDTTYRQDCPRNSLESVNLVGLDGNTWTLRLVPNLGTSFYIIKWSSLFLATLIVLVGYLVLIEILNREEKKRNSVETKRKFLENLTHQVRHDVASPMSALRMIAERAPLDAETKLFLKEAVKRTEGIFNTLKSVKDFDQAVDLEEEVKNVLKEKELIRENFPKVQMEIGRFSINVPRIELSRVLSNLLDNAYEAGASIIKIKSFQSEKSLKVVFSDNGTPIPKEVHEKLGIRGNTSGKVHGSGLGLYHAFHFMKSIGGELKLSIDRNEKVALIFPSHVLIESN